MNEPSSYSKRTVTMQSVQGKAMTMIGGTLSGVFLFVDVILAAVSLGSGSVFAVPFSVCGAFAAIGLYLNAKGRKLRKQIKRFEHYKMIINDRKIVSLKKLADRTAQSPKKVERDLQEMIEQNFFINAYIDQQQKCLILKNGKLLPENDREQLGYSEKERLPQPPQAVEPESPKENEILIAGRNNLREIRNVGQQIHSERVSNQIRQITNITEKILAVIDNEPQKASQVRRFMDYYLPTTLKLLRSYHMLERQGVEGSNISATMWDIEQALDTVVTAFKNQLDHLFQDTSMDISADIKVLESILAQEGLTDDGLKMK